MKIETRPGVYVFSSFTEKFGNEEITPAATVPGYKTLPRAMYDSEIKEKFGVEECTLADVAAFLENPPKGCDDGYVNLFYLSGFVVLVYWFGGYRGWGVSAWGLGDGSWHAGFRAFSRNWRSDTSASSALTLEALDRRVRALEEAISKGGKAA